MKTRLPILFKQIPINILPERQINCWTAGITKVHRKIYERTYPTVVVLSDGSTINIRYFEPRKIIKLPVDLTLLTEDERKLIIERRKPKMKVVIEEDIDDDFDESKYVKYGKY